MRFRYFLTFTLLLFVFNNVNTVYAFTDSYSAEGLSCSVDGGIVTAIRKGFVSVRLIQPKATINVSKVYNQSSSVTLRCRNINFKLADVKVQGAVLTLKSKNYIELTMDKGSSKASVSITPVYEKSNPIVFSVVGDPQGRFGVFSRHLWKIEKGNNNFVILLGDLVEEGKYENFQAFLKSINDFSLPIYCVPGNHDVSYGGRESFNLLIAPSDYSFVVGGYRFIMLDSSRWYLMDNQWVWLEKELQKQERCVVFMHVPPFSPNKSFQDYTLTYRKQNLRFTNLMQKYNVLTVFSGHIHGFQKENRNGVQYYVSGGGGAKPHLFSFQGGYYHYLQVTIDKGKCNVKVVKLND